jgi:hypothetical protein
MMRRGFPRRFFIVPPGKVSTLPAAVLLIRRRAFAIVPHMKPPDRLSAIQQGAQAIQGERGAFAPWWSITKSVLSAAVLKLAESGAVCLDDRFEDWPFTIRHLLQHTSGLTT